MTGTELADLIRERGDALLTGLDRVDVSIVASPFGPAEAHCVIRCGTWTSEHWISAEDIAEAREPGAAVDRRLREVIGRIDTFERLKGGKDR